MAPVTTTSALPPVRWQIPPIDPEQRWIGGAAAAIATEIGVQPLVIRGSFVVLALAGGWGLVFYVIAWAALAILNPNLRAPYYPVAKGVTTVHRHGAVAMIVLGLLLGLRSVAFGFSDQIVFPVGFVLLGILIAWTRRDDEAGLSAVTRTVAGVAVGVGGGTAFIILVTLSADLTAALLLLVVAVAVAGGVGIVAAPSLARIGRDLDHERQERARADERALVAAHLHDSVLQTLALIQRHATDPRRTAQLARQQERELRTWLYNPPSPSSQPGTVRIGSALEDMAAEVDATHGVPVKVITVGDNSNVDHTAIEPLVAAAREAAVNAAKHSGANHVDVFAERYDDRIEIFIRDTGRGFDPADTAADRRGIAQSIVARMRRAGGTATVHSEPGQGTEVELIMPLSAPNPTTTTTTTRSDP